MLAAERANAPAAWLALRWADNSLPSQRPRAVPRESASFNGELVRTRDRGDLRSRKQNGGTQSDSWEPLISPSQTLTGKPLAARGPISSSERRKGREGKDSPSHSTAPAARSSRPLPHLHAGRAPSHPFHLEAQQPPCSSLDC